MQNYVSSAETYRYKLNYQDFIKLAKGSLLETEKYLFLQHSSIEVEIHLEEILTSVDKDSFSETGFYKFYSDNSDSINKLMIAILGEKKDREYAKIRLSTGSFLRDLILCYMELIEICRDIQIKLISDVDVTGSKPIKIICNSYILNRLATDYTGFPSMQHIPIDKAISPSGIQLRDIQIRDIHIHMLSLMEVPKAIEHMDIITNKWCLEKLNFKRETESKYFFESVFGDSFLQSLYLVEMYDRVLQTNYKENAIIMGKGKLVEFTLPYFNNPSRNINTRDWRYEKLAMPKDIAAQVRNL